MRKRVGRSDENIAAVQASVANDPNQSISWRSRYRARYYFFLARKIRNWTTIFGFNRTVPQSTQDTKQLIYCSVSLMSVLSKEINASRLLSLGLRKVTLSKQANNVGRAHSQYWAQNSGRNALPSHRKLDSTKWLLHS